MVFGEFDFDTAAPVSRSVGLLLHDVQAQAGLMARLAVLPGWRLAFVRSTVPEALAEMERCAPSLLLVDLALPEGAALEALRQAGRYWPGCVAVAVCAGDGVLDVLAGPQAPAVIQHRRPVSSRSEFRRSDRAAF
jgi:CheY-like chemotaxis protein